MAQLKFSAFER